MTKNNDRLHTEELYLPEDPELSAKQDQYMDKLMDYNNLKHSQKKEKQLLLSEIFADIGPDCYIETPFFANFGGHHVHFGKKVYANFNLTLVDDTHIYVGDYTLFGPNVTIATAGHPIEPSLREKGYQYNAPVKIGKNCWLGAGVIVLPGITIGDNVIIGAGTVVTKDLPNDVVAVGNPAKIMRQVNEHDKKYYFKNHLIPDDLL